MAAGGVRGKKSETSDNNPRSLSDEGSKTHHRGIILGEVLRF